LWQVKPGQWLHASRLPQPLGKTRFETVPGDSCPHLIWNDPRTPERLPKLPGGSSLVHHYRQRQVQQFCEIVQACAHGNTESAAPATTFNHNRRKSSSKSSIKQSSRANPVQSLDYETHPQHISRHDRRVIIDHHVH